MDMEEEFLDLNVDDDDDDIDGGEIHKDSEAEINFEGEAPLGNSDSDNKDSTDNLDSDAPDENSYESEEQKNSNQEINNIDGENMVTDEGVSTDINTLKRTGDDIVGQPTKKQHVIDLTGMFFTYIHSSVSIITIIRT
jgi:hypothetical protein